MLARRTATANARGVRMAGSWECFFARRALRTTAAPRTAVAKGNQVRSAADGVGPPSFQAGASGQWSWPGWAQSAVGKISQAARNTAAIRTHRMEPLPDQANGRLKQG